MKKTLSAAATVLLLLALAPTVYADYIHGFFRYTVEDNSVTITAYTGRESVVTVPAMIAGNPVNTIAPGAFDGTGVTTVILPDTIMSAENGAFGTGQSVVYGGETEAPPPDPPEPIGIRDENGSLITTDDEGNLIRVDANGNETVLDDTQTYTKQKDAGSVTIHGESGNAVIVQDTGEVSFTDGEDRPVTVSAGGHVRQARDSDHIYEEVEIDIPEATAEETKAEAESTAPEEESPPEAPPEPSRLSPYHLPVLLVLSILLLLCCGIYIALRGKRRLPKRRAKRKR